MRKTLQPDRAILKIIAVYGTVMTGQTFLSLVFGILAGRPVAFAANLNQDGTSLLS